MQEWTDGVKLAVDVLVACIIGVALIVCTQLSRTIMLTMDKERAASADVLEYRVARMYDNEECYPQDIVSLVLEYQGSPAVNVTTRGGSTMSWSSSSYHTELTSASISAVLNQASTYLCTLTYDAKVVNPDPKSPGDTYMTYVGSDDIYHWNQGDLLKVKVTEVGPTGLASFLYSVFGLNMAPVDFTLAGRIRS